MQILALSVALALLASFSAAEPLHQDPTCPPTETILKLATSASKDRAWLRNLGCIRRIESERSITDLLPLTSDKDERLASAAAGGIVNCLRWHSKSATPSVKVLLNRPEASVRNEALRYVAETKWDGSLKKPLLRIAHYDESEANRIAAIYALATHKNERKEIEKALNDSSESVRGAAKFALQSMDSK